MRFFQRPRAFRPNQLLEKRFALRADGGLALSLVAVVRARQVLLSSFSQKPTSASLSIRINASSMISPRSFKRVR
jgi:hypothetical protein